MRSKKWLILCAGLMCMLLIGLCASACAEEYRTLKVGSEGSDVKRFKTAMYWLGYFKDKNVSDQYNSLTAERVKLLQKNNGLEETGEADAELQALVYSGKCVPGTMGPTPSPVPPPTPVPTPAPTPIPMPPQTEEGFLADAAEGEEFIFADADAGKWVYASASLYIEITRYTDQWTPLVWYEADIHCSPESPLVSYTQPNGKRPAGTKLIDPLLFARQNRIVLALSDDHYGHRINEKVDGSAGIIIREGQVIATDDKTPFSVCSLDVLAVFGDGNMKTFSRKSHTAQEYLDMGVVSTYSFGPILVQDGALSEAVLKDKNHYHEPRIALGMIEPYHYFVLCVEGRQERSKGAEIRWLAERMLERGVQEALNLDGGGTAILVFMGERVNRRGNYSTRVVGSMTGFGVSEQVPEPAK